MAWREIEIEGATVAVKTVAGEPSSIEAPHQLEAASIIIDGQSFELGAWSCSGPRFTADLTKAPKNDKPRKG